MKKIDTLGSSKFGQIGIVARDVRRAADCLSQLYPIKAWYQPQIAVKETFYRGRPIDLNDEVLIGFCQGIEIELVQINNDRENIYSSLLKYQDAGIHNIGFFINGFDRTLAALKSLGMEPIQWGTLKTSGGAVTRFAYFDTMKTCGTITKVVETKFLGLCMPHKEFMIKISALTGDALRI
jgi:hypothetical protein